VLASERGVVTAEFMLLMPALISVVALCLAMLNLGLTQVSLELKASQAVRLISYGLTYDPGEEQIETWREQHLVCVRLRKPGLISLEAEQCLIATGT